MRTNTRRIHILSTCIIAMMTLVVLIGQLRISEYVIDVGISATRSLTANMRVPEKIRVNEQTRTIRWSYQDSQILLPQTVHNAIVAVHTMTRADDAPASISMQSGTHTVAIDPQAGFRHYYVFVTQVRPLTFTCDATTTALCVAIDTVNVSWTRISHVEHAAVRWFMVLIMLCITIIFTSIPAQR